MMSLLDDQYPVVVAVWNDLDWDLHGWEVLTHPDDIQDDECAYIRLDIHEKMLREAKINTAVGVEDDSED